MFKFILLILSSFFLLNATTIEGTVSYGGNSKTPKVVKMDSDPICGAAHSVPPTKQDFILNENKFKNVIVWLKDIKYDGELSNKPATIDQIGCRYTPHVNAVTVGQKVLITNSDATLHNVNSKSKINDTFNSAQPAGVPAIKKEFTKPEEPFYIKCDVHPWMKAWMMVSDHPYFAVTDENGYYKIDNVPAGNYEIIFWQEKLSNLPAKKFNLPSNTLEITVDEEGITTTDFTFDSPANYKK